MDSDRYPSSAAAWYAVIVMATLYVFAFLDRQVLVLLVEPIKSDLKISDTQVSLLTGAAFAVLYSVMGVPFGWAADRFSRKVVISLGVAFWASMTLVCGSAGSFGVLFLARTGLGVGEAALTPTAHGMMPDLFPPSRVARGMAAFAVAGAVGGGLALVLGGVILDVVAATGSVAFPLLGEVRSWQAVFLTVGAFTLMASLLIIPMRDPTRLGCEGQPAQSTRAAFVYILRNWRAFAPLMIGLTSINMLGYGMAAWLPSYFIRVLHLSPSGTGYLLGTTLGLASILGILGSAFMSERMVNAGKLDAPLSSFLFMLPLSLVGTVVGLLSPSLFVAVAGAALACMGQAAVGSLGPVALQSITPPGMRSTIAAIWLMVANLFGIGLGPTGVALITDYLFRDPSKVGASLILFSVATTTLGCIVIWTNRRSYLALVERTAASA